MTKTVRSSVPSPKSERFELRLDSESLVRIDAWRKHQSDLPTRAETIRRLVELGMERSRPSSMEFRPADKLIIALLCEVLREKADREINPNLVMSAIYGGHYWALRSHATGMPTHLFDAIPDEEQDVKFVVDVLDMWDFLETAYKRLTKKEKELVFNEVGASLGSFVRFRGFDEHSQSGEANLRHIARFMIDELQQFEVFRGRDLNSHAPMSGRYRRMLRVFEPIRSTLLGTAPLSVDQVVQILRAGS